MTQPCGDQDRLRPSKTLRIFISYSRKDADFTRRLADALAARGFEPDFDQATYDPNSITGGIAAEDEWWQRLQEMISASDVMVFIVSPDGAESKVCDEEIAWARGLGKRIIAIKRRWIDYAKAPPRLSALNAKIDFTSDDDTVFERAANELARALDTNVAWHRESTRLTNLLNRWLLSARPETLLLSSADLDAISKLLEDRPRDAPEPAQALIEFRDASRARLQADRDRQRRIIGRAFVKPAEEANARGEHEHALRLAAAGALLAEDVRLDLVPELWPSMVSAITRKRTVSVLLGHAAPVTVTAFSPKGKQVVTGSSDTTARVWDVDSGAQVAVLAGHTGKINTASFSPDGTRVVTGSTDNSARLWDAESGAQIFVLQGHGNAINTATFSADGTLLVTSSDDKTARVWAVANGSQLAVLHGHSDRINAAWISRDCRHVMTDSYDGSACLWNRETGALIAKLRTRSNEVWTGLFSPEPYLVLQGCFSSAEWDLTSAPSLTHTKILGPRRGSPLKWQTGNIRAAAYSPDGRRVATSYNDHTVKIWSHWEEEAISILRGHAAEVRQIAFSSDGRRVATASDDQTARYWDAESGSEIAILRGHTSSVLSASFTADGKFLVTGSADATARLWCATSGSEIAVLNGHTHWVQAASFSADGNRVVTGSHDATARVWDSNSGAQIAALIGHTAEINAAAFSPDGKRVVTGSEDSTARVWDAENGNKIADLEAQSGAINVALFNHDGKRVVTGSYDATVRLWDVENGTEISSIPFQMDASSGSRAWSDMFISEVGDVDERPWASLGLCARAATLDAFGGSVLVGLSDGTTRVWNLGSDSEITIRRHPCKEVLNVAFDPHGKRVVTSAQDDSVHLWDADSGTELAVFFGHTREVNAASISPEGKRVVTGSWDDTARLWDVDSGAEIAALRRHTGSVFTASFSSDGKRVVTGSSDNTARIFDVTRTEAITRGRALVLTAALAHGLGWRTMPESSDLLLGELKSDDLFAEALRHIGRPADDTELQEVIAALRAPLHENCYLSPTQFAEKFGLDEPSRKADGDDDNSPADASDKSARRSREADEATDLTGPDRSAAAGRTSSLAGRPLIPRTLVTAEDLADQNFVESHCGVAIFRLADGRYHVVNNFAVATLDDARAAAEKVTLSSDAG